MEPSTGLLCEKLSYSKIIISAAESHNIGPHNFFSRNRKVNQTQIKHYQKV